MQVYRVIPARYLLGRIPASRHRCGLTHTLTLHLGLLWTWIARDSGGTERCEHSQECAYSNLSRCSMARSSQSLPPLRSTSLLHISAMTRGIRGYAAGMLVPSGWQANARRCCFYCDKLGVEFRLAHFPLGIIAPAPSQFTL